MTREELKALGIDGEMLDKIIDLHGKDVERYKSIEAENKSLKAQLDANADSIKQLEEKAKDNEALTAQIEELKMQMLKQNRSMKAKLVKSKLTMLLIHS